MKLVHIKRAAVDVAASSLGKLRPTRLMLVGGLAIMVSLLSGCSLLLPEASRRIEELQELPGVPADLEEMQGLMRDLGLPDLSTIGDVPGLDALPQLNTPADAVVYQGPVERAVRPGENIPGTNIGLISVSEETAEFEIGGLTAERRIGDSLDFDGSWPGLQGSTYLTRLRIYRIGSSQVRAAGVHRLMIENVQPQVADVTVDSRDDGVMRFPYTVGAKTGERFPGLTFGYGGEESEGARLTGLPEGTYPYRKAGDSITWSGRLRTNIAVEYHLRMLYYQGDNARIGGIVLVSLPGQ